MIKRDITETIYEYDNEGKLVRKTVTTTHEEEEEKYITSSYSTSPIQPIQRDLERVVLTPCENKISGYGCGDLT